MLRRARLTASRCQGRSLAYRRRVLVGSGIAVSAGCVVSLAEPRKIGDWMFVAPKQHIAEETVVPETTEASSSSSLKEAQEHPTHSALDGGKVVVEVDDVDSLPTMSLDEVRATGKKRRWWSLRREKRILVSYDGIVYDVTEFALAHPGGRELLLTAAGCDLSHFFANYTVHGDSQKAAEWLAPLAVGKLSPEDAKLAVETTTPAKHTEQRLERVWSARRRLLGIACIVLPAGVAARALIRFVGTFLSSTVAKFFARGLLLTSGVSTPGFSPGAEPLEAESPEDGKKTRVAVVGGGIAGCGAAWMLTRAGYDVTIYEARPHLAGNARTFDWTGFQDLDTVKSCVSVTAWPPLLYKNYEALLKTLQIETIPMPLSWFLVSKVPGVEGTLWGADPTSDGERNDLRRVFAADFRKYERACKFIDAVTDFFTGQSWWRRGDEVSMYSNHAGLGMLNPFNTVPLYTVCRCFGVSATWWDVIFTPYYTASFLVDELRPFPAVFGPVIERQIPLNPTPENSWHGASENKGPNHCKLTTCVTWKDAGKGIREVFAKLVNKSTVLLNTRVLAVEVDPGTGLKNIRDEHDTVRTFDRVVFACPSNAISNMIQSSLTAIEDVVLSSPAYADDFHPATGHMHAVMHSDPSVIDPRYREEFLNRGSNYVEVTQLKDGSINIENQYNFGIQTPAFGVSELPLTKKPVMLISHALGPGKSIDPATIRGGGNHARAHPLYSPWNVMAVLSLRLCQGRDGLYYCSNWTTPGNCHDMSLLSGMLCAHAIGAPYPFDPSTDALKDFVRLNGLMGVF